MSKTARTSRVAPGLYLTADRSHFIEHFEGFGLNEWRVFEADEDGERGEWCQSYATKADALDDIAKY